MNEVIEVLARSRLERHGQLPGSLELAYLGDTIYDLYVRVSLVEVGGSMKALNQRASTMVCAHAQAEALAALEQDLTDWEAAVVRRARNARQTPAKHADAAEYHRATGLEALLGALYLTGQFDRIDTIMRRILSAKKEQDHGL